MTKDLTVDGDKFDAILKRMLDSKPLSKAEISARINEKKAKLQKVQKMDERTSSRKKDVPNN